ncbi:MULTISPECIES: hypothetical protein [Burkholderia cepacia complex]|uniref:hypothetical protein n=1 Tax=Burkholderia cepacia complex TaxID=87882 RepID=UPI00157A6C3A|nr:MULTISPECIES: hypothetical protein [Burkholderia cepacia complex]
MPADRRAAASHSERHRDGGRSGRFYAGIHAKDASTSRKKRALRDAIDHDADLVNA